MTNYRRCVFCNKTDSPPSREHVLAEWISREFPDTLNWEIENIVNGTRFKNKQIALVTRKPCKRCNETWMSQLEAKVKPVLIPLMKGKPVILPIMPDQQRLIARWFTKTVITHEMLADEPYYFQPEERFALQQTLQVPEPTLFFIGHYRGSRPVSTYAVHMDLIQGENTDRAVGVKGYAATFTIKQLALQLFSVRPAQGVLIRGLEWNMPPALENLAVQILPVIDPLIRWLPQFSIDGERGLKDFRDRWTKLRGPSS